MLMSLFLRTIARLRICLMNMPFKKSFVVDRPMVSLYTDTIFKSSVSREAGETNEENRSELRILMARSKSDFYSSKITKSKSLFEVVDKLLQANRQCYRLMLQSSHWQMILQNIFPLSEDEMSKLNVSLSSATSDNDSILTIPVKECLDVVLPTITRTVNSSWEWGKFPLALKSARVSPLLKKSTLVSDHCQDYPFPPR